MSKYDLYMPFILFTFSGVIVGYFDSSIAGLAWFCGGFVLISFMDTWGMIDFD